MAKMVDVKNRTKTTLYYEIPELRVSRSFGGEETKSIDIEELKALQYVPGGDVMLQQYLLIEDEDALNELQLTLSDVYSLNRDDIKNILINGSNEDLTYFVKHAPKGGIEALKEIGIETRLSDVNKNKIIFDNTGYNIMSAIGVNDQIEAYNKEHGITTENTETEEEQAPKGIMNLLSNKKKSTKKKTITDTTNDFEVVE